jgi:two-component system CheB/CheR fusion protein
MGTRLKGVRILVVDDHDDAREAMSMMLEPLGVTVDLARNGPDALNIAKQHPPDVIFCDLRMPGMDGFAFLERVRNDPGLRRSRVIAVSGLASEDDVKRTWQAGFDGHLVKPITYDGLLARLKRTLWAHYHEAVPW